MHVPVIWGFIKPPWHSCARNLRILKTYTPWRCQKSEDSQNLHGMYVPQIWGFAKSTGHAWARNLRIHKAYIACICQRSFLHKDWPRRNQFAERRNECITSKPCIVITATFLTLCNREQLQATTKNPLCLSVSLYHCLSASRFSKTLFFYNFPVFPSIISSVRVCKLGFEALSLSPPLALRQWECCCLHGWQLLKRSNCWSSLDRFCFGFLEVCAALDSLSHFLSQSISCSLFSLSIDLSLSLSLSLSQIERLKARHYKFWMWIVFFRYNACAILQQHRESLGTERGMVME
jgi:hypothetical protein